MTDAEYFAAPGLSNSDFRLLRESPLHLRYKDLFPIGGDAVRLGSIVHKMVLEPDDFDNVYVIEDFEGADLNKNSKAYKEARSAWVASVGDREIVPIDQLETATKMARNVNAIAGGLLSGGVAEHAFFAEIDGVKCKCKADYYRPGERVVFDLKTTKSIKDFQKSILEYNYHTQSAFYSDVMSESGHAVDRFVFIIVETAAPHMVTVREMRSDSIEEGRAVYQQYLAEWKSYLGGATPNVVKTTGLPDWYMEKVRAS